MRNKILKINYAESLNISNDNNIPIDINNKNYNTEKQKQIKENISFKLLSKNNNEELHNINKIKNNNKMNLEDIVDIDTEDSDSENNLNENYDYDNEFIQNKSNKKSNKKNENKENLKGEIKYYTKAEVLHNTDLIFLNNSIYIKRKDLYMMTQESFRKIIKNVLNSISNDIKLIEIDILFKKISKKSNYIIYSQFNELLLEIIKKIYPENFRKNKKYTTNYFLNILFNCYSSLLVEENNNLNKIYNYKYNTAISLISFLPNSNQILIMNNIALTLYEIYEKYFQYEFSNNPKIIKKSSKNLVEFSQDFEILPYIMNETQIVTYYKLATNYEQSYKFFEDSKNKGILFTLNHFMLYIVHLSLYLFTKRYENISENIVDNSATNESKLLLFLERLQSSKGMKNFSRKLSRPNSNKFSLIPNKEIFLKVGEINPKNGKFKKNNIINNLLNSNYE